MNTYKRFEKSSTQKESMNCADSFAMFPASGDSEIERRKLKDRVALDISAEQDRQVAKFGLRDQSNGIWNAVLIEEVGEVSKAMLDMRFNGLTQTELRKELIQVAAVAKSWIENLDIAANPDLLAMFLFSENENG